MRYTSEQIVPLLHPSDTFEAELMLKERIKNQLLKKMADDILSKCVEIVQCPEGEKIVVDAYIFTKEEFIQHTQDILTAAENSRL